MKLSIIIPSYNEAGTIRQIIARVKKLKEISPEIIVVNDGSTDETKKILAKISGIKTINFLPKFPELKQLTSLKIKARVRPFAPASNRRPAIMS